MTSTDCFDITLLQDPSFEVPKGLAAQTRENILQRLAKDRPAFNTTGRVQYFYDGDTDLLFGYNSQKDRLLLCVREEDALQVLIQAHLTLHDLSKASKQRTVDSIANKYIGITAPDSRNLQSRCVKCRPTKNLPVHEPFPLNDDIKRRIQYNEIEVRRKFRLHPKETSTPGLSDHDPTFSAFMVRSSQSLRSVSPENSRDTTPEDTEGEKTLDSTKKLKLRFQLSPNKKRKLNPTSPSQDAVPIEIPDPKVTQVSGNTHPTSARSTNDQSHIADSSPNGTAFPSEGHREPVEMQSTTEKAPSIVKECATPKKKTTASPSRRKLISQEDTSYMPVVSPRSFNRIAKRTVQEQGVCESMPVNKWNSTDMSSTHEDTLSSFKIDVVLNSLCCADWHILEPVCIYDGISSIPSTSHLNNTHRRGYIIPIHHQQGQHWTVAVVKLKEKEIHHFDSLPSPLHLTQAKAALLPDTNKEPNNNIIPWHDFGYVEKIHFKQAEPADCAIAVVVNAVFAIAGLDTLTTLDGNLFKLIISPGTPRTSKRELHNLGLHEIFKLSNQPPLLKDFIATPANIFTAHRQHYRAFEKWACSLHYKASTLSKSAGQTITALAAMSKALQIIIDLLARSISNAEIQEEALRKLVESLPSEHGQTTHGLTIKSLLTDMLPEIERAKHLRGNLEILKRSSRTTNTLQGEYERFMARLDEIKEQIDSESNPPVGGAVEQ